MKKKRTELIKNANNNKRGGKYKVSPGTTGRVYFIAVSMIKKIVTGYIIFSLVFFIVLVGNFFARLQTLYDTRENNTINKSFKGIVTELRNNFLFTNAAEQSLFFAKMKSLVLNDKSLKLLAIYSSSAKPLFIYAEDKKILRYANPHSIAYQTSTGAPLYTDNILVKLGTQLKTALLMEVSGVRYKLDAFYNVIGPAEMYPLLITTLIVLSVFFLSSLILYGLLAAAKPKHHIMVQHKAMQTDSSAAGTRDFSIPASGESVNTEQTNRESSDTLAETQERRRQITGQQGPEMEKENTALTAKNLFSPFTGLGWKEHLLHKLKFELERSASFDQDLVLVLLAIDNYQQLAEPAHQYKLVADLLLESYKYPDLIFEYGSGKYALLLPDMDLDDGIKSMELFKNKVVSMPWGGITITCGLSARNGRLVEENHLLQETVSALEKARTEGKNQIMVFKADAGQYRDFLTKNY